MLNVTLEQAAPGSLGLHDVRNEELLPSLLEDENAIHKIVVQFHVRAGSAIGPLQARGTVSSLYRQSKRFAQDPAAIVRFSPAAR
jgi:hypothetical protein